MPLDIQKIRADFPALHQKVNGKPLIYFDNAATTQKPLCVINTLTDYYSRLNSNIHRGVHTLSQKATTAYEQSRETVREYINAAHSHEIIFTRGTTEAINLVAHSFGKAFVNKGDAILISAMEHHSNIVPWQLLCEEKGCVLKVIPINDAGEADMQAFQLLLQKNVKLLAITHVSNALGTINPIKEIISMAHQAGIPVLIDGAQGIVHEKVDVQELDADFYAFSAHKMYGPMGVGVLYGKEKWLEKIPPYQGGGEMISTVSFEKSSWNELPFKFEAGTPNVGDVLAFKTAIEYIRLLGIENIAAHEQDLLKYAELRLGAISGIRFVGTAAKKASVLSFLPAMVHPYDAGVILDKLGIAVRTGHHCAQPLMDRYNIPGTVRASFAIYNTHEEIDSLAEGVEKVLHMFA